MRVIAGSARSLKLKTLEGIDTRPTTDRIKETLFNMIAPYLYDCEFPGSVCGKRRNRDRGSQQGSKRSRICREKSQSNGMCQREFEVYQSGEKGTHTDQRM